MDGTEGPDAEDVTKGGLTSNDLYVCVERVGHDTVPANMVILYSLQEGDTSLSLNGTMEWNLSSDLPPVLSSNEGLEAITWVSDD
jgi:hypothetical protein